MQFRRVIDYLEGICILHNDPGIAQNLEITEQKSELTITNLNGHAACDNSEDEELTQECIDRLTKFKTTRRSSITMQDEFETLWQINQ